MEKLPHLPKANAFAIRFSEWQSLWRMRRIRQSVCCWQAFLAKCNI
jgi:hypothetical protein